MILLKSFFIFILMISAQLFASVEPTKTLMMAGDHAPVASTIAQAKKQVHFKDGAEYVSAATQSMQATPMETTTGTLTSPVQGACTTAPLSPLAALYASRFAQAHSEQWKTMVAQFLPLKLQPISLPHGQYDTVKSVLWVDNSNKLASLAHNCVYFWSVAGVLERKISIPRSSVDPEAPNPSFPMDIYDIKTNADGSVLTVFTQFLRPWKSLWSEKRCLHYKHFFNTRTMESISAPFNPFKYGYSKTEHMGAREYDYTKSGRPQPPASYAQAIPDVATKTIDLYRTCDGWDQCAHYDIRDMQTQRPVYSLQLEKEQSRHFKSMAMTRWNENHTRLVTCIDNDTTLCLWDINQGNQFMSGNLNPEQVMLVFLLNDIRKKYPSYYFSLGLNQCALLMQKKGVTTAELSRVLLTLDPNVRDNLLEKYKILTKKDAPAPQSNKPQEDPMLAQEDFLQAYQAFDQAQAIAMGHIDDSREPLGKHDSVKKTLEEYIVDEGPTKTRYINLVAGIHRVTEYQRLVMDNLFSAIKKGSLKDVLDNLNCETIDRQYTYNSGWSTVVYRTPLEEAITHWNTNKPESDKVFNAILHYQEQMLPAEQQWMVKQDFGRALTFALEQKRYYCALQVFQKMEQNSQTYGNDLKRHAKELLDENLLKLFAALGKYSGKNNEADR